MITQAYQYDNGNLSLIPVIVNDKYLHRDKVTGRFEKGIVPFNKGKKGIVSGGKATQYKTGHEPHNTKTDGCISLRKRQNKDEQYYFIRIAKGKWELYHRYLWQQHYGAIPAGHIVVFKDGNSLNCTLENLEMITLQENMQRNRNREKASATMRNLWKRERIRKQLELKPITKLRVK